MIITIYGSIFIGILLGLNIFCLFELKRINDKQNRRIEELFKREIKRYFEGRK